MSETTLMLISMRSLAILGMVSAALWADATVTSIGPEGGVFASLVADPQNPRTLYAGAHHSGVFKTTDGGANWNYVGLAGFTVSGHQKT